jgi:hypothetical protein
VPLSQRRTPLDTETSPCTDTDPAGGGGPARTVMLNACVAAFESLSVACNVNTQVCAAVGIPEIVPVAKSSDSPGHNEPELTSHATGTAQLVVAGC